MWSWKFLCYNEYSKTPIFRKYKIFFFSSLFVTNDYKRY